MRESPVNFKFQPSGFPQELAEGWVEGWGGEGGGGVVTLGKVRPWLNTAVVKSFNHIGNAPQQTSTSVGNGIKRKLNINKS
jgi:hypothetical protein